MLALALSYGFEHCAAYSFAEEKHEGSWCGREAGRQGAYQYQNHVHDRREEPYQVV